jgi:superfamily II DNA or RNA helicase
LLDEVTAVIVGLHSDHFDILYKKYSIPAPGFFFNPLYKMGRWDGKTHFLKENGRTFAYLLEEILPRIVSMGYAIEIEDLRNIVAPQPDNVTADLFAHTPHPDTGEPTKLRHYQIDGINELVNAGFGIVRASTGAGKTILCTGICETYGKIGVKTLTIVPSQDLISQTKKVYDYYGLDVGEYSGTSKDLDHLHVVSTWQALQNNPKVVELFQMVLVDECHGAKGKQLGEILTDHASKIPFRFGVTGTMPPEPADEMSVYVALGPIRFNITAAQLIAEGVLAAPHIDVIQLEEDLKAEWQQHCADLHSTIKPPTYTQYKDEYLPDFTSEKAYLHRKSKRIEWIANYIMAKADKKKGNVMCLVDGIPFGRKLAEHIPGAIFVNGQDVKTAKARKEIYKLFESNDNLVVIATVHIAGTGLDIPRIFNMILVDLGKSFVRVVQAVGRGLRKAKDKDTVMISDICSDLKYAKKHLKQRTNFYEDASYPYKKHKIDYEKSLDLD